VFTKPWTPPDRPEADVTHIVHILSWKVLLSGDLPAEAADLDADDRATALALVAMARHASLLSGREQLDEALALDPNADLVAEAVRFLDGGWDTALAAHDQALRRSAAVDH